MIRRARREDIRQVAELYYRYMFESSINRFGLSFLRSFIGAMSVSPGFGLYVHDTGGKISGFIVWSRRRGNPILFLALSGGSLFLSLLSVLIRSPRLFRFLPGFAGYCRGKGGARSIPELLFIAVDPAVRGKGIGRSLIRRALTDIFLSGETRARLSVVSSNYAVKRVLSPFAPELSSRFELHGKQMELYEITTGNYGDQDG